MRRIFSRTHLFLLALCFIGLAVPSFNGETTAVPKPPSDIKFIDPHVHAMSVTPLGLRAVAKWMEERNVERCIVSPLNHKGSRPQTEEERRTMLANFLPYKASKDRQMNQHYTFFEELDLPDEVRHKIYRGNAGKVYGLKKDGK